MRLICFLSACMLLAATPALAGSICDCTRLALTGPPVCVDGVTYQTSCVAQCQGVEVVPCTPAAESAERFKAPASSLAAALLSASTDTDAVIDAEVLQRFAREGFTFAAKLKQQSRPSQGEDATVQQSSAQGKPAHTSPRSLASAPGIWAQRMTTEGELYFRRADMNAPSDAATANITSMSFRPAARGHKKLGHRKLLDGREEAHVHTFPYSAIGVVGTAGGGTCTGTLVGPSTVLTAGHCVYDNDSDEWEQGLIFTPNVVGGGKHCHSDGSGCYDPPTVVASATSWYIHAGDSVPCGDHNEFICSDPVEFGYDAAVLHLSEPLGETYGWLQAGYSCGTRSYQVRIVGYPADLDPTMSRQFWMDGQTEQFDACADSAARPDTAPLGWGSEAVVSSNLDTAGGMSGGPVIDLDDWPTIRAIHVGSFSTHRAINPWLLEEINRLIA